MIEIGLVGCGFIGAVHSFALQGLVDADAVDARVTRVCDRDPDRARSFAEHHDAEVAGGVEALAEAVDAVWVCLPTGDHLEAVERSTAAGAAVFCEKPLGRDLAEARRVAEHLTRVPSRVGLVLRSAPVFRALADELAAGRHGRPMAAVFRDDQWFPLGGMYGSDWRSDASVAGAGTLLEHSIHDLDLLRWLLGDPTAVSATIANFAGHEGVEDLASVQLAFEGGASAALVSVWHRVASRSSTRRLEVFCEDALLWLDDDNMGPLHVETSEGVERRAAELPGWTARFGLPDEFVKPLALYATQDKEFLDDLAAGRDPAGPGVGDALAAHRLVDAAYRSAAAGGSPVVPEFR